MKRKARPMPKDHKELDLTVPLKAELLGSSDDPCFGKGHSITHPACKRCGDNEVCSIVSQQNLLKQSYKQEGLAKFKDLEETDLIETQNKKIGAMMLKRATVKKGKWLSIEKLLPRLREKLNLLEKEDTNIIQRCIRSGEKVNLIFNKDKTKYKL